MVYKELGTNETLMQKRVRGDRPAGNRLMLPRIAFSIALGASVLTEGCVAPNHPECAFYYRKDDAKACENVRCKIKEARREFRALEAQEKAAAGALRARIATGKEYREELGAFNSIHGEMKRISLKLDGYMQLEIRIRDGKAEEGEIRLAFEEVIAILGKIMEFERALAQMGSNI